MQNILNNSTKLLCLSKHPPSSSCLVLVPVRYLRKPKWVPIAESKAFRNVELKVQPIEGIQEVHRLRSFYKTYCKSLWLWQRQISGETQSKSDQRSEDYSEEVQLRRIIFENEEVNIRVKSRRDKELVEEWTKVKEEIEGLKRCKETEEGERLEAATKQVLVEMERIKTSINLEDLDEAIEKAMSSEVDYNYAIDKSGNVIRGRHNNGLGASSTEKVKNN